MISYLVYKNLHLLGIFLLILSLGGSIVFNMLGAGANPGALKTRKFLGMCHGISLFLVLLGGFGLMARLGIHSFPVWILGKLAIWVILGGLIAVIRRKPELATTWWWTVVILASMAAYLALNKPMAA